LSNNDRSLFYRIVAAPYVGSDRRVAGKGSPCPDLVGALSTGTARANLPYFRFWHGYQVYLRPMLSLMPLSKLYRLNAILLCGTLLFLAYRLSLWFGPWALPAILLPFAVGSDLLSVPLLTAHMVALTWVFLSVAIFAMICERRNASTVAMLAVAFCVGAISNFLSFLFNPPLAPAFMAFLTLARFRSSGMTVPRLLVTAVLVVGFWFGGFMLAWATKWVLAAIVLGLDAVATDILTVASGARYLHAMRMRENLHIFKPTLLVISVGGVRYLWGWVVMSWAIAGAILIWLAASGRLHSKGVVDFLLMQTPLLVPVGWVELLRYHSVEHAYIFSSRNFVPLAILPLLAALALARTSVSSESAVLPARPKG
jgi:hypothetical protein